MGVIMTEGKCVRVVAKVLITIDMCNYFRVDYAEVNVLPHISKLEGQISYKNVKMGLQ